MLAPVEAGPGIFIDSRTVILALGGLFGGLKASALAVILAAGYRIFVGGIGATIGIASILISAVLGIIFRYLVKSTKVTINRISLLALGFTVHVIVFLLFFLIPNFVATEFLHDLLIPYFVIMPLSTVLIGFLIQSEEQLHIDKLEATNAKIQLENTLNNLQDALFIIKPGSRSILGCNKAVEDVFGYHPKEMIGHTTEILHLDLKHFNDFAAITEPKLIHDSKIQVEYPMRKKNGAIFPAEITISILKNDIGEWINVVSVVRDISARLKRIEQLQFQSKLIHSVGEAVIAIDNDGKVSFWNQAAEEIYGWSRSEVIGKKIQGRLVPEDYQEKADSIMSEFQIGRGWQGQFKVKRKSGETFPAFFTSKPINGKNGELLGIITISRDITKQQEAEAELLLQAQLINSVAEAVIATNKEGIVIFWNDAAQNIYGWTRDEALGKEIKSLTTPSEGHEKAETVLNILKRGLGWQGIFTVQRKNGEIFPAQITNSIIKGANGEAIGYIGVSRDITEKVKTDIALKKQTEQLRAMALNISRLQENERKNITRELHDQVGQMLAALGINLSVLAGELDDEHLARLEDSQTLVEQINNHLRNLMEDLRPSILDNHGLTAALGWYFDRFMKRTGIKIHSTMMDIGHRLPDNVKIAFFRITQEVLTNILKHSEAKNVYVTFNIRGDNLILDIKDDGKGFDPQSIEEDEAGLGLIHMRERAESVEADLFIISTPEEGTLVQLSISSEVLK